VSGSSDAGTHPSIALAGCIEAMQRLPQDGAAGRGGLRPMLRHAWRYLYNPFVLAVKVPWRKVVAPQLPFLLPVNPPA
jgi:hypothetical protein